MDYQKGYLMLFNAISEASETIEHARNNTQEIHQALQILRSAQEKAEDWYINEDA